ncbi:MAG: macro domain-containing protein, partial [Dongiaceae bacterium]
KARHVIHTVGPVWRGGEANEDALLAACYRNSLELAGRHRLCSVTFPSIGTGAYRFPLERATRIAVATVASFLAAHDRPETVIFCCFGPDAAQAYRAALAAIA